MSNQRVVSSILILPLEKAQFGNASIEYVQNEFFLKELPIIRKGVFDYTNFIIDEKEGTFVLFQYDRKIIAAASFLGRLSFSEQYPGANSYLFQNLSIVIFNPINGDELRRIFKGFKDLNNDKQRLDVDRYKQLSDLIIDKNPRKPNYNDDPLEIIKPEHIKKFVERVEKNLPIHFYNALKDKKYSAGRLSEIIGCSERTIYKKTSGKSKLSVTDILVYEYFFGINRDRILGINPRDKLYKISYYNTEKIKELKEKSGESFNSIINSLNHLSNPDSALFLSDLLKLINKITRDMSPDEKSNTYNKIAHLLRGNFHI